MSQDLYWENQALLRENVALATRCDVLSNELTKALAEVARLTNLLEAHHVQR